MTKAPTRTAKRRAPRVAREPLNPSRAAGEPAPASAASTQPPAGPFYDPEGGDSGPARMPPRTNPLLEAAQQAQIEAAKVEFAAEQRARSVEVEDHSSADISVARQVLGIEPTEALSEQAQYEADVARVRALQRSTFGLTQKLALPRKRGYHSHWFNAEGGRIDDAAANGWAHRLDSERRPIRRAVGRGRDQGVLYAYAMDIPEVFWLEDMAARHKMASDKMEALKAQPFRSRPGEAQASDRGKFYDPVDSANGPLEIRKG